MTKNEIIKRLRALSEEMIEVGTAIDYYYGLNSLSAYGAGLVSTGIEAGKWVSEMEKDNAIEVEA